MGKQRKKPVCQGWLTRLVGGGGGGSVLGILTEFCLASPVHCPTTPPFFVQYTGHSLKLPQKDFSSTPEKKKKKVLQAIEPHDVRNFKKE